MIADFFFVFWILIFSVPLYWTLARFQLAILCLVSFVLIWSLSPIIVLALALYIGILVLFMTLHRLEVPARVLRPATWFVFLPLAFVEYAPRNLLAAGFLGDASVTVQSIPALAFVGISYTAIRAFIMIRETQEGQPPTPGEALTTFLFFGSFVAGPITGARVYRDRAKTLTGSMALMGIARIGWGAAMFLVAQPFVQGLNLPALTGVSPDGTIAVWLRVFQDFIALYLDFTGYTDMAIGCAMLFGIRLPENFNWPLRATSIQEFWQRWHMSLGAFIGTYLFKPLVRHFGKPTTAIFLAFTAVGLWHQMTLPYFLWGVGHGAALALNMIVRKRFPPTQMSTPALYLRNAGGWLLTMAYVSVLSAFATSESAGAAFRLLGQLVGVGT